MNYQITWSDLQTEKREKRREAIIEMVSSAILIILIALFLIALIGGYFSPGLVNAQDLNARAVNYLYEMDMRHEITLNSKAISALQAINK